MGAFVDQVKLFRRTLHAAQSPRDGGWPHELHEHDTTLSIASTAHAIDMLRYFGRHYSSDAVAGGLRYLSAQVKTTLQPERRGLYNRYATYALWGLTRYRQSASDRAWAEAFAACLDWLETHQRADGGWPAKADGSDRLSLVVTMPAVTALQRLNAHPLLGERAQRLTAQARHAVLSDARRRTEAGPLLWHHRGEAHPSHAQTALAVLTLADSHDDEHQGAAEQGAKWLARRVKDWAGTVESDPQQKHWWILTWSLALRAIIRTDVAVPNAPQLKPAFEALAPLWDQEAHAWSPVPGPGAHGSMSGSFAVLSAVRAATRAWSFDPFDGLPATFARPSGRRQAPASSRHRLRINDVGRRLTIFDSHDIVVVDEEPTPRVHDTLVCAARLHVSSPPEDRSFALSELAAALSVDDHDNVRKALIRANDFVVGAARDAALSRPIQDVATRGPERGTGGARRFAIDDYDVELIA